MPKQRTYQEVLAARERRRSEKSARAQINIDIWRFYADPGRRVEWRELGGELLPWQKRFETWFRAAMDINKHGMVLCARPGVGKSCVAAKVVAACAADRACAVIMPGSILDAWHTSLCAEGVREDRFVRLTATTRPSDIRNGAVILASMETFTTRDPRAFPPLALLVIDERKNIAQTRASMLARVETLHVLMISADPPNSLGCWILNEGRRRDDQVYTEDMFVADDEGDLPPLEIHAVPVDVPIPDYARVLKEPNIGLYSFNYYRGDEWTEAKIARAVRDVKQHMLHTLIYVSKIPAPEDMAEVARYCGISERDVCAVGMDRPPPFREREFNNMRVHTPRICFVQPNAASVGIDLSMFDAIALCVEVWSESEFVQIAGRIRRYRAAKKDVFIYYGRDTHEELLLDRRYYAQNTGELVGQLVRWAQARTERHGGRNEET